MPLTVAEIKAAKAHDKGYLLRDGQNLVLWISKAGTKSWQVRYRHFGKENTATLGRFPSLSLAQARTKRDEVMRLVRDGLDPNVAKRNSILSAQLAASDSFEVVATDWFETRMQNRSKSHRDRTWRALEKDIFPFLSKRPISDISAPELLQVLRKIEARGAIETAHRAKQTAGQIFRFGIATGRADRDVSGDLKGALRETSCRHR